MSESVNSKQTVEAFTPNAQKLADHMKLTLSYDELTNCMRCGFCQPACPTFKETGLEAASPRGRIALMKAVVDGIMPADESFQRQIDLCLGCRACEPVCPADVKYGQLLEETRESIEQHREHSPASKLFRSVLFRGLFPHQRRLQRLGAAMRFYQRSSLPQVVRKLGVMKLFPQTMRQMEAIMPEASGQGVEERLGGTVIPAAGKPIARVGMFRGCIMDVLFTDTNVNTVKLLTEAGFEVVIPDTQNCCGALHAHAGEMKTARELAVGNIEAFREAGVDYIVSNAGGCGALLIEYDHLLAEHPQLAGEAKCFAEKVKDVSQLLMEKGRIPQFAQNEAEEAGEKNYGPVCVTYQDSCHLRNVMKAGNAPRDLLERVGGIRFVELQGADRCCGSAGIYNLLQEEMSTQILDHKMEHVRETEASYVVTSNPGCLLQMKLGIEREGLSDRMEAVHIVDFLYDRTKAKRTDR